MCAGSSILMGQTTRLGKLMRLTTYECVALVTCHHSFSDVMTPLKVGQIGGGRGRYWLRAVEGDSRCLLALTKGCSRLLLCKIVVYFRISQHPFSFCGCFLKSDFERMIFFFFFLVIGTKELDHASKGNQFCLFVECPFLTSLLWSITSFCPFRHSFPSFVHFPSPPQYWFGYSEYHFVLLLSFPFLTKLSYRDAWWDVSHLTWSLWTNLSRTVGRVGIVLVSLGFVFV